MASISFLKRGVGFFPVGFKNRAPAQLEEILKAFDYPDTVTGYNEFLSFFKTEQLGINKHYYDLRRDIWLAYAFGYKAHEGQFRNSGHPQYEHSKMVVRKAIITYVNMLPYKEDISYESLAKIGKVGLLHDTPEDNPHVKIDLIGFIFGEDIATHVEALQKSTWEEIAGDYERVKFSPEKIERKIEDYDLTEALVAIADRWDNLRTLSYLPNANQERKKRSTVRYVRLAKAFDLDEMADELEHMIANPLYRPKLPLTLRMDPPISTILTSYGHSPPTAAGD